MNLKYINIMWVVLGLGVYGCSNNSSPAPTPDTTPAVTVSYEVIVTNLTAAQPIAPVAVVLHTMGYEPVSLGSVASVALEKLAEGGDNTLFLSEADTHASVLKTWGGAGALMPSASETFNVEVNSNTGLLLSVVGMLVNTNDGFVNITGLDVSGLVVGNTQEVLLSVYDAGTEDNTESMATLPGLGGVGFATARDDVNFISIHRGVVTMDDGLTTSGLNESHRFDNPAVKVSIRRIS